MRLIPRGDRSVGVLFPPFEADVGFNPSESVQNEKGPPVASLCFVKSAFPGQSLSLSEQPGGHRPEAVSSYGLAPLCHEVAVYGCIGRIVVSAAAGARQEVKGPNGRSVWNGGVSERKCTCGQVRER